mgnify:CR=1 FL=1
MKPDEIREEYQKWLSQVTHKPEKFESTFKQMQIFLLSEIAAHLAANKSDQSRRATSVWEVLFGAEGPKKGDIGHP